MLCPLSFDSRYTACYDTGQPGLAPKLVLRGPKVLFLSFGQWFLGCKAFDWLLGLQAFFAPRFQCSRIEVQKKPHGKPDMQCIAHCSNGSLCLQEAVQAMCNLKRGCFDSGFIVHAYDFFEHDFLPRCAAKSERMHWRLKRTLD